MPRDRNKARLMLQLKRRQFCCSYCRFALPEVSGTNQLFTINTLQPAPAFVRQVARVRARRLLDSLRRGRLVRRFRGKAMPQAVVERRAAYARAFFLDRLQNTPG